MRLGVRHVWGARTCMQILVASVLPAPDSPDTRIDWEEVPPFCRRVSAACATGYTCGGSVTKGLELPW